MISIARWVLLVSLGSTISGSWAVADSEYERLLRETPWKVVGDVETRTLVFRSGVKIEEERRGAQTKRYEWDDSGLGAIGCARLFYIAIQAALTACGTQGQLWRTKLLVALDRIDDFIVANSLTPITKREMSNMTASAVAREKVVASVVQYTCRKFTTDPSNPNFEDIQKSKIEAFRAEVDKLLSVPRPPVANPCL